MTCSPSSVILWLLINRRYIQAGTKDSEINVLSLKRAEDLEREHSSSLHHSTLSPLGMDIFLGDEQTQVSENNLEKPPKAWFLPRVHLVGSWSWYWTILSPCPAGVIPSVLEALEIFTLPVVTLLIRPGSGPYHFFFFFPTISF